MTPEQYSAKHAVITAAVGQYVLQFTKLVMTPALGYSEWLTLLRAMFPEVQRRYAEAATLARDYYDSERELHHPELPRNEMLLTELQFDRFVQNMAPARNGLSQADSPQRAATNLTLRVIREVEMAGRRQIIGAVKNDPEPQTVKGWARVATGRETCAWCLMLISRGPVYMGVDTAGLDLDDYSAAQAYREAGGDLEKFREEVDEHMEQWHPGCDCLVVPVFDRKDWPGKAAQERAQQLWIDASRVAQELIDSGKARSDNLNKETQNALRRRLERGDLSMTNYAFAA